MRTIYNKIPIITDLLFWASIIIIGLGALVTLYKLCSKKWTKEKAFKFLSLYTFTGVVIATGGTLLYFIYNFEPIISSVPYGKQILLISYGLLLISFGLSKSTQKTERESEKNLSKEENQHG